MSNGFQLHLLLLFVVAVGGGVADWQLATVGAALVLPVSHGSIREALSNLRVNRRSSHLLFVLTCVEMESGGGTEIMSRQGEREIRTKYKERERGC